MENVTLAPSQKTAFPSDTSPKKAPPAPSACSHGEAAGLSFADVQIHYNNNSGVVQCHDFFTSHANQTLDQVINAMFDILGIDAQAAENLKRRHMNFNQVNGLSPARPANTAPVTEATIQDFILAQLERLEPPEAEEDHDFSLMKTGAILNGISRMLAHKLGDVSATDKILQKIMERLSQAQDSPAEVLLRQKINAYARENPILAYLHDEVNSHDASVLLLEQTAALKTGQETDAAARERIFTLMERQALVRIRALKDLQSHGKNIVSMPTSRLYFEDPIGLYSQNFLDRVIDGDGAWNAPAQRGVDKLKDAFLHIAPNARIGKHAGSPTLAKARHHERKSYEGPVAAPQLCQNLQDRAVQGIKNCFHALFPDQPAKEDAACRVLLGTIVEKLREAPVMISRFASDLLARELSSQSEDLEGRTLKAGTPHSYVTLDELVNAQHEIRRLPPGQQPDPDTYTPANSVQPPESFSYTALLPNNAKEAIARGVTYPIFRSNKNRLYAAKTQDSQPAVFGTLDLLGERMHHGLVRFGSREGTYGDVVLVFRKNVFQNLMYTLGDRMRGYTSLEAFVYNAFAPYAAGNSNIELASEALIPGYTNFDAVNCLVGKLLFLGLGETSRIRYFEDLEVQIFDPVQLSRAFIREIYFAGNVPIPQRRQIRDAINGAVPALDPHSPGNTLFYQYPLEHSSGKELILDQLYDKTSATPTRAHMTSSQLIALLDAENYEDILRQNYGFHSSHQLKWRTRAENEQYQKILQWLKRVRAYRASRPEALSNQELNDFINGTFELPEVL